MKAHISRREFLQGAGVSAAALALAACGGGGGSSAPSATPTAQPTAKPTAAPTATPTAKPTATPKPTFAATGDAVKKAQISAINEARSKAGKNTLTENAELAQAASRIANAYASYGQGKVTKTSYENTYTYTFDQFDRKVRVDGAPVELAVIVTTKLEPSFTTWSFTSSDSVVTTEASYIGNAVVTTDDAHYCVTVLGEPDETIIWKTSNNGTGTVELTGYSDDGMIPTGNITIPETIGGRIVTGIGYAAFQYCDSITGVTISGTVTIIGNNAFERCTNLKSVVMNYGTEKIGESVFKNCTSLETVTFPASIKSISYSAFENCSSLKEAQLAKTQIYYLNYSIFENCTALTRVSLPRKLFVYSGAFNKCSRLTDVYYLGTKEDWGNSSIVSVSDFNNSYFLNATFHYNSTGF